MDDQTQDQQVEEQVTDTNPPAEAEPSVEAAPKAEPEKPPMPYKAFAARTAKYKQQAEEKDSEIGALRQEIERMKSQVPQAASGARLTAAQQAIADAVSAAQAPLLERVGQLEQRTQEVQVQAEEAQTRAEFNRHRQDFRQYVSQNFKNMPNEVVSKAEEMVDTLLQENGQIVEPMEALKLAYGDWVLEGGNKKAESARRVQAETSAANQDAVSVGHTTVAAVPHSDEVRTDFENMSLEEMRNHPYAKIPVTELLKG
jgi:DNA repair exonuclease SbcCD ATPase subunit